MAQVHHEKLASAEVDSEAMGSEELVGVAVENDLLDRLESQVVAAVERIVALTRERDELRTRLLAQDETIESLQAASAGADAQNGAMQALREERDRLLRERAAAAQRVEAVLDRLERLGLE